MYIMINNILSRYNICTHNNTSEMEINITNIIIFITLPNLHIKILHEYKNVFFYNDRFYG